MIEINLDVMMAKRKISAGDHFHNIGIITSGQTSI